MNATEKWRMKQKKVAKAEGLCGTCLLREPLSGFKSCQECLEYNRNKRKTFIDAGLCRCGKPTSGGYKKCSSCRKTDSASRAQWEAKIWKMVLDHYGNKCACRSCGESDPGFLTIDHINNDGYKTRDVHHGGIVLYSQIVKADFPSDLRLLCFNCNEGRQRFGACPHTKKGQALVQKKLKV